MTNDEQEKQDLIFRWLNERWGDFPCPVCHTTNWNVETHPYQLMEFHDGNLVVGGRVIPVIPVTCSNCGYTVFLNGVMCGAVKNKKEPENDASK